MVPSTFPCGKAREGHNQSSGCFRRLFRKEPVALAGGVSQVYHQILLRPVDRPLHRFLYSNLDIEDTPKVYEFETFILPILCPVFLGTSCQTSQGDLTIGS